MLFYLLLLKNSSLIRPFATPIYTRAVRILDVSYVAGGHTGDQARNLVERVL
jgi:hypothetical protein